MVARSYLFVVGNIKILIMDVLVTLETRLKVPIENHTPWTSLLVEHCGININHGNYKVAEDTEFDQINLRTTRLSQKLIIS